MDEKISFEKWIAMSTLAVISAILGLIPYYIFHPTKSESSVPYKLSLTTLSCFGGGVLLSTAILHLLPEVREGLHHIPDDWIWNYFNPTFPVAEMLMLVGFLVIYLVEEVAHCILIGENINCHKTHEVVRHNSIAHGISMPIRMDRNRNSRANLAPTAATAVPRINEDFHLSPKQENGHGFENDEGQGRTAVDDNGLDNDEDECMEDTGNFTSSLRAIMALVALSFHSVMEGLGIGIQRKSDVWVMFAAVASHKFVISFCMGMELMSSKASFGTYVGSISFFAVVSPIGIIIGSLISSSDPSSETLPVLIVQGVVCGTLLYVVFFEILDRERDRKTYSLPNSRGIGFIQFISLLFGLLGMAFLTTVTHDQEHEHERKTL